MPDFPIVLVERKNTFRVWSNDGDFYRFGWKLTLQSESAIQLTVHTMDNRPGINRLLTNSLWFRNFSLEGLFSEDALYTYERFRTADIFTTNAGDSYQYIGSMIERSDWIRGVNEAKQVLLNTNILETCNECGEFSFWHGENQDHVNCAYASDFDCETVGLPVRQLVEYSVLSRSPFGLINTITVHICHNCDNDLGIYELGIVSCSICGNYADESALETEPYLNYGEITFCAACLAASDWCEESGHYVPTAEMESIDQEICTNCFTNARNPSRFIQSWNFRPMLEFYPEIPTDPLRPLYIGLELEMSWPGWQSEYKESANDWLEELTNDQELLYVKSDSSVSNGFEVVTHPMEPKWALDNFPFEFFQRAINLGARADHHSCGTHIHVSKAAMTTAQVYKLLQLHLNLKDLCGTVGERGTTSTYASWDNTNAIKANLKEIAVKKGQAFGSAERYVPVNVRNEETLELRYMAGSIDPEKIRKNIEWVQALYDFTEYITIEDVKNGVLNSQNYLLGWVLNGNYPSLANFLSSRVMIPTGMPERSV